jgi:diguanylate cyclase (GGDEF)-like protein
MTPGPSVARAVPIDLSDTTLLDVLPTPAFVVAVDHDDPSRHEPAFRFDYVNEAFLVLLGGVDDATGDLRSVLPTQALVSFVRAFARAAHELRPVTFESDWGGTVPKRILAVNVTPIVDEVGACHHLIGTAHEVTDERHTEAQLAHRTRHDPLTELPNRVMLVEWLQDAILRVDDERCVGVVLLDIDHFKIVNDSLGHAAGDELLSVVAARVDRVLRGGDKLARLGGDELAIVCHNARTVDDVATLGRRVLSVLDEAFVLESGDEVYLGASVGVAASIGRHDEPARLLRDADVAMFAAKELGRGRVEVFDETMRERAVARLEMEGGLRRALLRGEFRVHYQPLVHFDRSEVIGFEALVRWEHPERGLLAPADFLTVAEETGLIVPIGAFVLQEACAQAARWAAESNDEPPLTVSVNLSARQLADAELLPMVESALTATGLDASLLVLEVTEGVLTAGSPDQAVDVLQALAKRGVRIGIDDFGTGQSSLGYLKALPVHTLKIDQAFVESLAADPEDAAIVAAVVSLGHSLGLTVLAEGIENSAQLHALRALGCDLGQGYYFARPQPGEVVRALVHHRIRWSGRESA